MSMQITAATLTTVDLAATPSFQVGAAHVDTLGRLWNYIKLNATISQYDYVTFTSDNTFVAVGTTTTTNPSTQPLAVGCVQAASSTAAPLVAGNYCWAIRSGLHQGNVSAATAVGVKMYTTATAGKVSSSATTLINGLTATVAAGAAGTTTMNAFLPMGTALS